MSYLQTLNLFCLGKSVRIKILRSVVGILTAVVQVHGQESSSSTVHESPEPFAVRGILEVDPESGAASLYFSLGPGIGNAPIRYLPALVGRLAPQIGIQQRIGTAEEAKLGPTLQAATAFEPGPGYLDLPLTPMAGGRPGVINWTYPDGTGGSASLASASAVDPVATLSRFGYAGRQVVSPRFSTVSVPEVVSGFGGDCLMFVADDQGQMAGAKAEGALDGPLDQGLIPFGALAIRGDVAYEYQFTETWSRVYGEGPQFAHYRLKAMRSSTGETCRFTYGCIGVDFLASCEHESVRVPLEAAKGIAPVPALDDGLRPPCCRRPATCR